MLLEIDNRLNREIRDDLIRRACRHDAFIGVVINAQYLSNKITENEWKNDWAIPPHLKSASLLPYKDKFGTSDLLRDSYGLLKNENS